MARRAKSISLWYWAITLLSFVVLLCDKKTAEAFARLVLLPQSLATKNTMMGRPSSAVLIPDTSTRLILETGGGGANNSNNNCGGGGGANNNRWNEGNNDFNNDEQFDDAWYAAALAAATTSILVVPSKTAVAASAATTAASTAVVRRIVPTYMPTYYYRLPPQPYFIASSVLLPMVHWAQGQCYIFANAGRHVCEVYMHHLETSPLLTKSITSGLMGVIGDVLAQYVEHVRHEMQAQKQRQPIMVKGKIKQQQQQSSIVANTGRGGYGSQPFHFNSRRSLAILLDGIFISGPLMHLAYNAFEYLLPVAVVVAGSTKASSGINAMVHVLADSLILDGIFVASAMTSSGLLEGYSLSNEIIPQLKSDYLPAMKASFATSSIMAPIQYACFRYLPLSCRVLAMNFTDIVWDAVISFMSHRARTDGTGHLVHSGSS